MSESSAERERLEREVETTEQVLKQLSEAISNLNAEKRGRIDELRGSDEPDESGERAPDGSGSGDEDGAKSSTQDESEAEPESDREDEEETDGNDETAPTSEGPVDIVDIRQQAEKLSEGIIGRPLDGVNSIQHEESGGEWKAVVDVIERRSIPDTQDILGSYEIHMDSAGVVTGYHRLLRYRRGDRVAYDEIPPEWR